MLKPRPYQQAALDALTKFICEEKGNPCVVLPTGAGKSLQMAWSIALWLATCPWIRVCILAHRKELVEQNAEEMRRVLPDADIGIYSASIGRRDADAQILYASIDSIYKKSGDLAPFDVIFVDEAHRIPGKGEGKYLTFLNGVKKFNDKLKVVGFTATPYRMGSGMICHKDHMLNEICYEANVGDLIRDGYLAKLRSKVGVVRPDVSGIKKTAGEYNIKELGVATGNVVVDAVTEAVRIIRLENRKSSVFFCVNVEHANQVSSELERHGLSAPVVTGKSSQEDRDAIVESFKAGKIPCLCNVSVYTEGFNAKRVDCIVLLRPTLSAGLYSQMVGRGLRLHDSKDDCLVLDFAGCINEHGPIDALGGEKVVLAVCGNCRESFSRQVGECPECGWEIPKRVVVRLEAEEAEKRMHASRLTGGSILSGQRETLKVSAVFVSRYRKPGKPDSLLVQYRCGTRMISEWVCLDHTGYAQRHARDWWITRWGSRPTDPVPTVSDALANMLLPQAIETWTKTITISRNGKYKNITDYNQPMEAASE